MSKLLSKNGLGVIASFISPYRTERERLRKETENFIEVFCNCPLGVCEKRDSKGLYLKARSGEIKNFTGISDPYEKPENPEIELKTDKETIEESVNKVIKYLQENKLVENCSRPAIGIIGVGMVGGALKNYFKKQGAKLLLYDNGKNFGSIEQVNQAEIIFICVPTPYDKQKGFDLSYVEQACDNISGNKIIVIKSTVLPGTTETLQEKYPQHKFLFNPEFLVEERATEDMFNPDRQIIGCTEKSKDIAQEVLKLLPPAPYEKIMKSQEAETIKYFGNAFLATKVIFGNQMYDLCQKLGIDYEIVKDGASADKRIGPSHLDVHHGGYFGYGGRCLPKDIRALIQFADQQNVDLKLHKLVEEINNELMKQQGIDDPERFSKRD